MAAPNSAASKKAAKADAKKAPSAKSTPATKKTPTLWTGRLKNSPGSSKKTPAPTKKASILRKTGAKKIKKTMGKKGKEMLVKDSAKKTLGGTGKASAFDLEAFVKVKFSELEKTAHQKKV